MPNKHKRSVDRLRTQTDLVLVVVKSSDARYDYWMTRENAVKLGLQTVNVYQDQKTYYDPDSAFVKFAVKE